MYRKHMGLNSVSSRKLFAAVRAAERLFTRVNAHVSSETVLLGETQATFVADKRFLASVYP